MKIKLGLPSHAYNTGFKLATKTIIPVQKTSLSSNPNPDTKNSFYSPTCEILSQEQLEEASNYFNQPGSYTPPDLKAHQDKMSFTSSASYFKELAVKTQESSN